MGEGKNNEKHDDASTSLCTVVDRDGDAVPVMSVNGAQGDIDKRKTMVQEKMDGLGIVVEGVVAWRNSLVGVSYDPRAGLGLRSPRSDERRHVVGVAGRLEKRCREG